MVHPHSLGLTVCFDYTASVHTRVRRFLLLLLMLALPGQAFASAAMMSCALPQQDTLQTMVMADEMMAGCHEPEQSAPTSHDCKHCTACALASALPIPASDTPAIMPVPTRYSPQPAASFSAFVPEGPERPPRSPLV
jgi:hypothetical protein